VAEDDEPRGPATLAYEPTYPWITGMGVAEWDTQPT
jgi:hypothetical protein